MSMSCVQDGAALKVSESNLAHFHDWCLSYLKNYMQQHEILIQVAKNNSVTLKQIAF